MFKLILSLICSMPRNSQDGNEDKSSPWSGRTLICTSQSSDCPLSFSQVTDFCSPRHFPALKSDWSLSFPPFTIHFQPQHFAHWPIQLISAVQHDFCQIFDGVQSTLWRDCSTFIHPNFADYIFGGTDKNALLAWEHDQITGQQRGQIVKYSNI